MSCKLLHLASIAYSSVAVIRDHIQMVGLSYTRAALLHKMACQSIGSGRTGLRALIRSCTPHSLYLPLPIFAYPGQIHTGVSCYCRPGGPLGHCHKAKAADQQFDCIHFGLFVHRLPQCLLSAPSAKLVVPFPCHCFQCGLLSFVRPHCPSSALQVANLHEFVLWSVRQKLQTLTVGR